MGTKQEEIAARKERIRGLREVQAATVAAERQIVAEGEDEIKLASLEQEEARLLALMNGATPEPPKVGEWIVPMGTGEVMTDKVQFVPEKQGEPVAVHSMEPTDTPTLPSAPDATPTVPVPEEGTTSTTIFSSDPTPVVPDAD